MATNGGIQSILVATDLTQQSLETLRAAADLGIASGARVRVVHAHEAPSRTGEILVQQRRIHEARRKLVDAVEGAFTRPVKLDGAHVRIGAPADVILAEARDARADVIILGPHRKRGFADRILGSTAEAVLRRTAVPCLILNGPLRLPVQHLLVPTDFSQPARAAARVAIAWGDVVAPRDSGRITLAHMASVGPDSKSSWARAEIEADLRTEANDLLAEVESPVPVEVRMLLGRDVTEEVLLYADVSRGGLVVLGTHGDSPVVRTLLGSVSAAMVRRSPLPLLLVPPDAETDTRGEKAVEAEPIGGSRETATV